MNSTESVEYLKRRLADGDLPAGRLELRAGIASVDVRQSIEFALDRIDSTERAPGHYRRAALDDATDLAEALQKEDPCPSE